MLGPFSPPVARGELEWRCGGDPGWDENVVASFVGSEACGLFFKLPGDAGGRLCVQAQCREGERTATRAGVGDESGLVALALVTLEGDTGGTGSGRIRDVKCTLVGLAVASHMRGKGVGQALFERTHAEAFKVAQRKVLENKTSSGCFFDFRLHQGACFRHPIALCLYHRNGASVSLGDRAVATDTLHSWARSWALRHKTAAREGSDSLAVLARAAAVDGGVDVEVGASPAKLEFDPQLVGVHFEKVPLNAPYLSVRAFPQAGDVQSGDAFQELNTAGVVRAPDSTWLNAIRRNVQLKLGALTLGGVRPDPRTGCVALTVSAHSCALLESYLRDPVNTVETTDQVPMLVLKRDRASGEPALWILGYETYGATAAPVFSGPSQLLRTRQATRKDEREGLLQLPGCRAVLEQAAGVLDRPPELLMDPHRVHVLCQDEDLQAGFGWHTDGPSVGVGAAREDRLLGLAVQLSNSAASAMWVHGFEPQVYMGQGACVLFHGGCIHRTLPWAPRPSGRPQRNVVKIVFFYVLDQ